jgi:SNF2 family DNA or RNA helicase
MFAEIEDDGRIRFQSSYAERSLVRSLPGAKYDRKSEQWYVTASWVACLTMRSLFGSSLELGPKLTEWAWEEYAVEQEVAELAEATEFAPGVAFDPRLFGYQKAGAEYLCFTGRALLGDEPGLGKSAQTIQAVKALHDGGRDVFPVLIICPNSLKRVWEAELEKWWLDGPELTIVQGSAVQRRKQLRDGSGKGHIINWESVRLHSRVSGYGPIRLKSCAACGGVEDPRPGEEYKGAVPESRCETHQRELNLNGYKTVIVDEAHKMKDPNAKQTRAVWSVLDTAKYKYALTGTPIGSNVGDIWSILRGLDPDAFSVRSKFLDIFAVTKLNYFGGFEVLGLNPEHAETFRRILALYMRRIPKVVALPQLPPKLEPQYRYCEMSPKQAKQYSQMRDGMLTIIDSGQPLVAVDQLSRFNRLKRLACATGSVLEDGRLILDDPSCKVDDLLEFVEDNPGQLVVAAVSRQLIELAEKRLRAAGYKTGLITGKQTLDERYVTCEDFQAGKIDVVLLTMGAAKEGITLTAADTIFFLERSPSLLDNTQTEDRIYRIGSERHDCIRVVISLTADTIEDNREAQLAMKSGRFEEVVQDRERARRMLSNER